MVAVNRDFIRGYIMKKPIELIYMSKTFMIESVGGEVVVPQIREITTENGTPLPGKEAEAKELISMLIQCEEEHRMIEKRWTWK